MSPLSSPARLDALQRTALLDSPAEAAFDRLTRLATRTLGVPVSLVSLVTDERQFFKSCVGLPEPWATRRETPLSHSFCQHTVTTAAPLVIEDARAHPLVRDSLAIPDLDVIAYAGIPLVTSDGAVLGSFCAIDSEPRRWSPADLEILADLAASVMTEIELRTALREVQEKRARAAALERAYRLIFDRSPHPMFVFDIETLAIVAVNEAAQAHYGYSRAEWLAMRATDLRAIDIVGPAPRDVPDEFSLRSCHRARDGRLFDVDLTLHPFDFGGRPARLVHVTDVTAELRAAAGLRAAKEQAERANRAKSEFLAHMTHELRSPLTSIIGFARLLARTQRATLGDTELDHLGRIEKNGRHLLALIDNLLDLSRVESGHVEIARAPTDVARLACDVVASLEGQRREGAVELHCDVPAGPVVVDTDAAKLRQVLINLVGNALKFTARGHVAIVVRPRPSDGPGGATIEVRDTGIGIPADRIEAIFEPYEQASVDTSRRYGGTGLGLTIARALTERLGGRLSVTSELGVGTAFRVEV